MNTRLKSAMGTFFVEAEPTRILIRCEQDAVHVVGFCGEQGGRPATDHHQDGKK